jgi:hypothetical protein
MSTVNYSNPKVDLSVRVFDSFYDFDVDVPAEQYDIVYSFFRSVFTTDIAAGNFTVTLFRIAEQTSTPVLTLLEQIQDSDQLQITATLAYFLNGLRSPSTLLGYSTSVTPNFYAARNVKA